MQGEPLHFDILLISKDTKGFCPRFHPITVLIIYLFLDLRFCKLYRKTVSCLRPIGLYNSKCCHLSHATISLESATANKKLQDLGSVRKLIMIFSPQNLIVTSLKSGLEVYQHEGIYVIQALFCHRFWLMAGMGALQRPGNTTVTYEGATHALNTKLIRTILANYANQYVTI